MKLKVVRETDTVSLGRVSRPILGFTTGFVKEPKNKNF